MQANKNMSITPTNWYNISATKDEGGLTVGRDRKYGQSNYGLFYMLEREMGLGMPWSAFFPTLLSEQKVNVNGHNTLVVGINDGQEYECIATQTSQIIGFDIAHTALSNGTSQHTHTHPNMHFFQASAASLPVTGPYDSAFCLRTFQVLKTEEQSSLLGELRRTVKGQIVMSLPAGYLDINSGQIIHGNIVSGAGPTAQVDAEKPLRDAHALRDRLESMGCTNIRIVETPIEIFLFAESN